MRFRFAPRLLVAVEEADEEKEEERLRLEAKQAEIEENELRLVNLSVFDDVMKKVVLVQSRYWRCLA